MPAASVPERRPRTRLGWMLWPVRLLSLTAVGIAGYLFWATLGSSPIAGCDPASGFDCNASLTSRWAQWFGVPVLWIGAACYAAIFLASWGLARKREGLRTVSWHVFVLAVLVAAGAGLWFLALQLTGQSSLCPYCIGIHACGLTIATMVGVYLLAARMSQQSQRTSSSFVGLRTALASRGGLEANSDWNTSPPPLQIAYAGALLAVAALVSGQVFFVPPRYQIAAGNLEQAVDLSTTSAPPADEATGTAPAAPDTTDTSSDAERHEALKVDPEEESVADSTPVTSRDDEAGNGTDTAADLTSQRRRSGSRKVSFLQGKLTLDLYEHPMLGSPDAEHVILEFFDYTCPHCRKMHKLVKETLPQFGDRLAVVVLPVPLDVLCNKHVRRQAENHQGACRIANLAVAMHNLDPTAFVKLHDWLMEREETPTYSQCLSHAMQLAGESQLLGELSRADVADQVQRYIETQAALSRSGNSSLPLIIIGDEILTGEYASAEELREVWEERLGIKAGQ